MNLIATTGGAWDLSRTALQRLRAIYIHDMIGDGYDLI